MFDFQIFRQKLDAEMREVANSLSARVEALTREQFLSALTQAIDSGDFMRYVTANPDGQTVVYHPFRRQAELESRIAELESELERIKDHNEDMAFENDLATP